MGLRAGQAPGLVALIGALLSWLTGGVLDRILGSVDHAVSNETTREEIRANAANRYAETAATDRADARKYRFFWYVWMLFTVPTGLWWALVSLDTALPWVDWGIPNYPPSVQDKVDLIFASLFGSGGLVASAQAISSAIRGRR